MSSKTANKMLIEWFDAICAKHSATDSTTSTTIRVPDAVDDNIVHVIKKLPTNELQYSREDPKKNQITFKYLDDNSVLSDFRVTTSNLLDTLNMMNSCEWFLVKDGLTYRMLSAIVSPRWATEVKAIIGKLTDTDLDYLDNAKALFPVLNFNDFTPETTYLIDYVSMTPQNVELLNRIHIEGMGLGSWLRLHCRVSIAGTICVKTDPLQVESPKTMTISLIRRANHSIKPSERYVSKHFHVRDAGGLLAKMVGKSKYVLEKQI